VIVCFAVRVAGSNRREWHFVERLFGGSENDPNVRRYSAIAFQFLARWSAVRHASA
jgi:hypothetical protein